MAAQRRFEHLERQSIESSSAANHLSAADGSHRSVASPAAQLQARLGAALAYPEGANAFDDNIERWPAATRLIILFGGAIGSWLMVWKAAGF